METNAQIGTVLHFDEARYNRCRSRGARLLLPACNALMAAYQQAGLQEPFTTALLHELVTSGMTRIRRSFEEQTKKDLSAIQSPLVTQSALQQIDTYLLPVANALENLEKALSDVNAGYYSDSYTFSTADVRIENGQAVLDEEAIKNTFTTRINNENQLTAYRMLSELAEHYNRTREFVLAHQWRPVEKILSGNGYICPATEGDMRLTGPVAVNIQAISNIRDSITNQ